jgi:hypothetical protein
VKPTYQEDDDFREEDRVKPRPAPLTEDTKEYLESGRPVKEEVLIDNILASSVTVKYIQQKNKVINSIAFLATGKMGG